MRRSWPLRGRHRPAIRCGEHGAGRPRRHWQRRCASRLAWLGSRGKHSPSMRRWMPPRQLQETRILQSPCQQPPGQIRIPDNSRPHGRLSNPETTPTTSLSSPMQASPGRRGRARPRSRRPHGVKRRLKRLSTPKPCPLRRPWIRPNLRLHRQRKPPFPHFLPRRPAGRLAAMISVHQGHAPVTGCRSLQKAGRLRQRRHHDRQSRHPLSRRRRPLHRPRRIQRQNRHCLRKASVSLGKSPPKTRTRTTSRQPR